MVKKVHKGTLSKCYRGEWARSIESVCKIENKTSSYDLNYRWDKVTCQKCLMSYVIQNLNGKKARNSREG